METEILSFDLIFFLLEMQEKILINGKIELEGVFMRGKHLFSCLIKYFLWIIKMKRRNLYNFLIVYHKNDYHNEIYVGAEWEPLKNLISK